MNHPSLWLGAFGAILLCVAPGLAQNAAPALYTAAQAQTGAAIFANQCAGCHGADLGGLAGPALTGPAFHQMAATRGLNGATLLDAISRTMPLTAPGKLQPEEYAALVAFILQRSGYPAGNQPLTKDSAGLSALNLALDPSGRPAAPPAPPQVATRPASGGVYTAAQAARGKGFYSDNCLQCHGAELEGVEDAPPLAGKPFMAHWGGQPVGAVHAFIDKNMPPGNGGALGAVSEADVVAYILSRNGFAAGTTPLPSDPTGLSAILLQ